MRVQVRPLRSRLERALTLLPRPLPDSVESIDIVLVDRATMTKVHADFFRDPTDTDVITFPYGEIVVCPAVAEEAALAFGHPVQDEVLLYALHGLLHLAGYDDKEPTAAAEMAQAQDKLLKRVLSD